MSETPAETLAAKLARIAGKCNYLQKKGVNREQRYNYAQAADYLELVSPFLAEEGIAMLPNYELLDTHEGETKSGTKTCRVTLSCAFTFKDGRTGEELTVTTISQGVDTQDKAPYKAMTGGIKYALGTTFMIPTGDDPENDSEEHPEPPQKPALAPVDPEKYRSFIYKKQNELGEAFSAIVLASPALKGKPPLDPELTDDQKRAFAKELAGHKE